MDTTNIFIQKQTASHLSQVDMLGATGIKYEWRSLESRKSYSGCDTPFKFYVPVSINKHRYSVFLFYLFIYLFFATVNHGVQRPGHRTGGTACSGTNRCPAALEHIMYSFYTEKLQQQKKQTGRSTPHHSLHGYWDGADNGRGNCRRPAVTYIRDTNVEVV